MPNITDEQLDADQATSDAMTASKWKAYSEWGPMCAIRLPAYIAEVRRLHDEISASKFFAERRGLGEEHEAFMKIIHSKPGKIDEQDIAWAMGTLADTQDSEP